MSDSEMTNETPLVIRFGALGDMILMTPLLRALAARHGCPCDIVGRGKWIDGVFENLGYVGDSFFLNSRKSPYFISPDQKALVNWLKVRQHVHVYLAEDDDKSHRLMKKAGLKNLTSIRDVPKLVNEHVVDHHRRLGGFDEVSYNRNPELRLRDKEKDRLELWLKSIDAAESNIVLLQFGNRKTMKGSSRVLESKHWPAERWLQVIGGVLDSDPEARILIIGSDKEQPMAAELATDAADQRVIAVADQLPLRRLFRLVSRAHSMISVDTGPAHAAAALGCPLVVLFGQTDPRVNAPVSESSPVVIVHGEATEEPFDGKEAWAKTHSMMDITTQQVLEAWANLAAMG
jgi:heptosyltransferase-2/heptosyltransferase-3